MTGRHRSPQQMHPARYRAPSLQHMSYLRILLLCCASCIFNRRVWYRALSLHMRMLWAMSPFWHRHHSPGYPCAKFRFCCAPTTAKLTCREKLDTQSFTHSLSHSSSLFDLPGTETYVFGKQDSLSVRGRPPAMYGFSYNHMTSVLLWPWFLSNNLDNELDPNILKKYLHIRNEVSRSRLSKVRAQTRPVSYTHLTLPTILRV